MIKQNKLIINQILKIILLKYKQVVSNTIINYFFILKSNNINKCLNFLNLIIF